MHDLALGRFPAVVRIETTNACNAKCIICPHRNIKRPIRRMDEQLCRLNVEYEGKRRTGRLGPIRTTVAPVGGFARDEARQIAACRAGEQYKHKDLVTDILQDTTL